MNRGASQALRQVGVHASRGRPCTVFPESSTQPMKQATTGASRSWSGESPPTGRWLHPGSAQITKNDDLRSCFDPIQPAMSVDIAARTTLPRGQLGHDGPRPQDPGVGQPRTP
jgi:hypothetical protein